MANIPPSALIGMREGTKMPDQSELDKKYFIDGDVYNCPYCNRRNVTYRIVRAVAFHWSDTKGCQAIFVMCQSCQKISMHLSHSGIARQQGNIFYFSVGTNTDIDDSIFYSVPTSFFVIDKRIPKILRELLDEAEGCLKSNFLTGASACARKLVYELAIEKEAEGSEYDKRIKSLKAKLSHIDPTYFDTLLTIHQVTSEKVHEQSYDGWEAKHLRVILSSLKEILHEVYVASAQRKEKRKAILKLKAQVTGN